ncbi:MAG: asparagine synthase (glutamine-hydrolyzing) [Ruminococcaceae bacterium]|nr:asparagine synthase (glutamine-hydrolyzing) [Oscillospiraceae bacterium]
MCGFIGYFSNSPAEYDRELVLDKMGEAIAHRGPDSKGSFLDGKAALGFRRLSIIDLEGGDQPIHSACGRYVIIFNGEIYNYRELREGLIKDFGCTFATNSDTETILQTYLKYGKETASRLRGMFAFVIYDKENHSFYGARDYFGIKPFYYAHMNDTFLFGSEIKGFLPHPAFEKKVNPEALKMYLEFQYSPLGETMFKNVFKLTPGCYFTYENGVFTETPYFEATLDPVKRSFDEAVKLIDDAVLSSVEYHQIADVEVGSFLSGGVDSSYVASTVRPMKTYSVGFKIEGFDETSLAEDLCKTLGMPNKKKEITPDEFFAALPHVQYHSDEPHANLSAVPLYYLSELAAKDVKVVLSGEGADEFFGGYDWYIQSDASRLYKKLPQSFRTAMAKLFGKFPVSHIKHFFKSNAQRVEDTYIGQAFIMKDADADKITADAYKSSLTYKDVTAPYYEKVKNCDDLTKKMYLDMHLWLPYDILLKADKMTMAHSLEARVPYLDKEVWAVARTLLSEQKMKGRHTKRAFRKAALSHIPLDWANRKKAGFMVPFRVWIRDEKFAAPIREAFSSDAAAEFFNRDLLLSMLDEHVKGEKNNARVIYTVYSFLLWHQEYFVKR